MKRLLSLTALLVGTTGLAQNQAADYARLATATRAAYSVPEVTYTYKIESRSTYTATPSSNSKASMYGKINSGYSSFPPINVNAGRLRRQQEAGDRNQALVDAWAAKERKMENLLQSRGLAKIAANWSGIVAAAREAGFTEYEISRQWGNSQSDYASILRQAQASEMGWISGGGTCTGDCKVRVGSASGGEYYGNTLNGIPHGKGIYTTTGFSAEGDWVNGVMKGTMTFKWSNGSSYTGGYKNNQYEGKGMMQYPDGQKVTMDFNAGKLLNVAVQMPSGSVYHQDFMKANADWIHYINGTRFSGILNDKLDKVFGTYAMKSSSFLGSFKNDEAFRGRLDAGKNMRFGEFGPKWSLKYGMTVYGESADTVYGFFNENNLPHTYYMQRNAAFVREYKRTADFLTEATGLFFPTNEHFIGVYRKEGKYLFFGIHQTTKGRVPAVMDTANGIFPVPAGMGYDPAQAEAAYQKGLQLLEEGRVAFRVAMDNVYNDFDGVARPAVLKKNTVLLDNWTAAKNKYNWLWLETPENDPNAYRYLKDGTLHFTSKGLYSWTMTAMGGKPVADYTYEARFAAAKEGFEKGEYGTLVQVDENGGQEYTKLIFLVRPDIQSFYFGTYNPVTKKWRYFTNPEGDGWVRNEAVKNFSTGSTLENQLKLVKEGNQFLLYVNNALVLSYPIDNGKEYLKKYTGIGIIHGANMKGTVPDIRFIVN